MNMFNISIVLSQNTHRLAQRHLDNLSKKKEKTQHTTQIYLIILFFLVLLHV